MSTTGQLTELSEKAFAQIAEIVHLTRAEFTENKSEPEAIRKNDNPIMKGFKQAQVWMPTLSYQEFRTIIMTLL